MESDRYSRNEALFGKEGQRKLVATKVVVVGSGGLGSPVGQQLAFAGVRDIAPIDFDVVTDSSLNRLIGAVPADVVAGTKKVVVADRTIKAINPNALVNAVDGELTDKKAVAAITRAD